MSRILLGKNQLECLRVASEDSLRPQLNGIHVAADGSVTATSGHALLHVSGVTDCADYPTPPEYTEPDIGAEGVIIPRQLAVDIGKALPKGARTRARMPILCNALLESVNGSVNLSTTDMETRRMFSAPTPAGPYPLWTQVKPPGPATLRMALDPELVRDTMAALVAMGATSVTLELHATENCSVGDTGPMVSDKPIVLRATTAAGESVYGLVMSMLPSCIIAAEE